MDHGVDQAYRQHSRPLRHPSPSLSPYLAVVMIQH